MQQSPLWRDWDWIQEQVIPPLLSGRRPSARTWSVGSMADAIAVTVAFTHSARSVEPNRRRGLRAYASGCQASRPPITFGTADLGSLPAATRDACFRRQERRWVPESVIADRVMLGEPTGPVDLVTLRRVDDLDGNPVHGRLRRGGYLLLGEPPADLPADMRAVDGDGRLFQRMTAPRREDAADTAGTVERAESLARRDRQQMLVQDHINLARSLARQFAHRGQPTDDLDQVAFLALVKAARRFDPEHQAAFSTYATVSIQGELKRHFRDKTWMLRVPRSAQELYLSIRDVSQELGHQIGRSPTPTEIAARLDVDEDRVLEAMQTGQAYTPSSLDTRGPDGEQTIDIAVTDNSFAAAIDREQLRTLLPRLDERERLILKRIYFDGETQQQVATHIGASQMQVSRTLARTLAKLRRWSNDDTPPADRR